MSFENSENGSTVKIRESPVFLKPPLLKASRPRPATIHLHNSQKDLSISSKSVRALVKTVLEYFKAPHVELAVYFVSVRKICQLHAEFFGTTTATDCISFPMDEEHLGEVFVCPKTAIDYAVKRKKDPFEEVALYLVHGLLHCLGYDDLEPNARRTMRKKEKICMALIKKRGIYLRRL